MTHVVIWYCMYIVHTRTADFAVQYVTDEALCYVKFRQLEGNGRKCCNKELRKYSVISYIF